MDLGIGYCFSGVCGSCCVWQELEEREFLDSGVLEARHYHPIYYD